MTDPNATTLAARKERWVSQVSIMPQPADPAGREALSRGGIQRPLRFSEFRHFCNYMASAYGRFGHNMFPSVATLADDVGESETTVKRWLAAAVELGMLKRTRRHTRTSPAVYQIAEFWDRPVELLGRVVEADQIPEEAVSWPAA